MTIVLIGLAIGCLAGVLSGLVGIGGGVVIVPILTILGLSQREASGTSLAGLLLPVGILGVLEYNKRGEIKVPYAVGISIGLVVGVLIGSIVAGQLSNDVLRKIFGVLLLVTAIRMLAFN